MSLLYHKEEISLFLKMQTRTSVYKLYTRKAKAQYIPNGAAANSRTFEVAALCFFHVASAVSYEARQLSDAAARVTLTPHGKSLH